MLIERTIRSVLPVENGVQIRIGDFNAITPTGCLLKKKEKVELMTESRFDGMYLIAIVSDICLNCPLMGDICRYGQAP